MKLDELQPYCEFQPRNGVGAAIFSSPHSGRAYPSEFLTQIRLDAHAIRMSEDAYVDLLFNAAPEFGATLICATAPRSYVDLNRSPGEIDPELVDDHALGGSSIRSRAGYGVVPSRVGEGAPIYDGMLSAAAVEERLRRFFHPFHNRLEKLAEDRIRRFGEVILFDCHSMPHRIASNGPTARSAPPDVILGDRFGQAASAELMEFTESAFAARGLSVARNTPFPGAYISKRHGRPELGRHAIQIEIDRSLYMDEVTLRPNGNFATLKKLLRSVTADLAALRTTGFRLAAE